MDIRLVSQKDTDSIKEMWSYCFGDKDPFLSWYFEEKYSPVNTVAVYEHDRPVSSVQLLPYELCFHDKVIHVSYIVGAATLPEVRGKRYMEALLKKSMEVMRKRGHFINILLPFKYPFYRKYGWETCYYHKHYKIEMNDLKPLIKRYGRLRPGNIDEDIYKMLDVYGAFTSSRNGCIVRTYKDMKSILTDHSFEDGKVYILESESGGTEGYILYSIQSGVFNIHEMAYVSTEAYKGLLWFVYSHTAQAEKLSWKAPEDDLAYIFLSEPRQDITLKPFVTARVIDVEKVLKLLIKDCTQIPDITMHIEDTMAEWNNETFAIQNGRVQRCNDSIPDLVCSINTFTQMAMGFISPSQAYHLGLLQQNNKNSIEKAHKIFKISNNFINDYY